MAYDVNGDGVYPSHLITTENTFLNDQTYHAKGDDALNDIEILKLDLHQLKGMIDLTCSF